MEHWYSGAVVDAVREAKSRQALFIVYLYDESEKSQIIDRFWLDVWSKLSDKSKIVALRLDKSAEATRQFTVLYKVQTYPTIYFINAQNGSTLKVVEESIEDSDKLLETIEGLLNNNRAKETATIVNQPPKTVDEKVAEARARLKEIQDKREEEAKEKEKEDEMNRRRLGQQMLLDKQKKNEELIRKQAEEIRRDKIEQQKLQEKLQEQIRRDREEKRRQYEQKQSAATAAATTDSVKPQSSSTATSEPLTPKINYTRARLQFRLTDGTFFTEDFSADAHMNDVYAYLRETLPANQYTTGSYVLRAAHTRVTLTRENSNTLKELELVPSAVLLVLNTSQVSRPSTNSTVNSVFQIIPLTFTWLMMQLNFIYQFIIGKLFGNNTASTSNTQTRPPIRPDTSSKSNENKKDNFRVDSTGQTTIRRFHNTQDDSEDDEKRTWNGNSTQQL